MYYQFGLIGSPIKHSLSPWIHKQLLNKAKLTGEYNIMELKPDYFTSASLEKLKNQSLNGFNVTVPYKEQIIPFLDELDEEARKIGAVNTVLNDRNNWIGFNTDGIGYVRALQNEFPDIYNDKSNPILVLGAGGAARGIYHALLSCGFKQIDIANRTKKHALSLAKLNNKETKTRCFSIEEAATQLDKYKLIIQTTSVGMKPNANISIMRLDNIQPHIVVSDIIYQPLKTVFLKEAEEKGARIHFGHTMLLHQAQYAFEIWTGQLVPIDSLKNELQTILEEYNNVNR